MIISHVLFVDDCMLFGEASVTQWDHTNLFLNYIATWTRLSINPTKS